MNPVKLTMQAFGSYRKKTTIDFTLLGEHPLFLITGATGGGKTTILDAMCFALYGRSTGGRRSWGEMRSLGAAPEEETLVEFIFSYRNTLYKWFRSRKWHISKRTKKQKEDDTCECFQQDEQGQWKLLQAGSDKALREQAEQLLGLTCEQFSQVAVLPQGDFLKLLLAKSVDKAKLLQTLFGTQKWEHLTRRVRDKAEQLKIEADKNVSSQNTILEGEQVKDRESLQAKCKKLQEGCEQVQKALAAAQKHLEDCSRAYDLASKAASNYDQRQRRKTEEEQALVKDKEAEQQAKNAQAQLPKAEDFRGQAAQLREEAAARESALAAARRLRALQKETDAVRKTIVQKQQILTKAEQDQQAAQEHRQAGNRFVDDLHRKETEKAALDEVIEREKRRDAAAVLAVYLRDGCACPVCGALEHPNPTQPPRELVQLQQQAASLLKEISKLPRANARVKELEQMQEAARSRAQQARDALAEQQRVLAEKEASQKEIVLQMQGSASCDQLEQTIRTLRQRAAGLEQQEQQLRRRAADAQSAAAAAHTALQTAQKESAASEDQYQKAIEAYRSQPNVMQGVPRPDDTVAAEQKNAAQRTVTQLAGEKGRAEESFQNAQRSCRQLQQLEEAGQNLGSRYAVARRLADMLSGRTAHKVPIQQFVLGIMLDDILSSANNLFSDLSGGRYRLLRWTGPVSGNAMAGLDLVVQDAASGGERDVATLSGGELFLASLSLAFGLSDVVQSYSGTVRLDSLFIDEGFGSLDQETLDTTMGALLRLQKTGRTIGIISHVTELQTVIKKQIIVELLPDGSSSVRIEA